MFQVYAYCLHDYPSLYSLVEHLAMNKTLCKFKLALDIETVL
jgi:hypothetical protein